MSLTREQFDQLVAKYEAKTASLEDLAALEPYRAKRAVLLASGFGSRMLPITINTPKPLVNVNGRRIVTTILDALVAIGIQEIYIVTGYLKEQFTLLKQEYPQVRHIYNPVYDRTNNISSACLAKDHFSNAYVFESDLFLTNPSMIKPYRYDSCYMGVPVESTPDWCFDVEGGIITDLHKGGRNMLSAGAAATAAVAGDRVEVPADATTCYHMYGISYWNQADGQKLAQDLPEAFNANEATQQRFWDDVPCVIRRDNYRLHVEACSFDDVAEIDSFAELQEIDPRYRV